MPDVQAKIAATGRVPGKIDTFDTAFGTPTAAQLAQYDAVLTLTDRAAQNPSLLGDRLANYVDSGGGVVQATFSWHNSIPLSGRWRSGGYSPLTYINDQSRGTEMFIGARYIPGHPILTDVNSFSGGAESFRIPVVVAAGATAIADWTDDAPLVAEMGGFAGRIIALNFYPVSGDERAGFWDTDTDGDLLLANALAYVDVVGVCVREPEWICDGDADGDGQVNPVDSGLVQAAFGSIHGQDLCNYDMDCDGQINPVDAGIVQSLFGTCEAPRDVCP